METLKFEKLGPYIIDPNEAIRISLTTGCDKNFKPSSYFSLYPRRQIGALGNRSIVSMRIEKHTPIGSCDQIEIHFAFYTSGFWNCPQVLKQTTRYAVARR